MKKKRIPIEIENPNVGFGTVVKAILEAKPLNKMQRKEIQKILKEMGSDIPYIINNDIGKL